MSQRAGPAGATAPMSRVKPLFFGQTLNFSRRSQQLKSEFLKITFFVFIKRKKNGILSVLRGEVPENREFFLPVIVGWSQSGKAVLQVSIAVFTGSIEIFSPGKDGLAALEILVPTDPTPMRGSGNDP